MNLPITLIFGLLGLAAIAVVFFDPRLAWLDGVYARRLDDIGIFIPYRWILTLCICMALIGLYLLFANPRR